MGRKRQFIEMDFHSAIEQAEELEKIANNLLDLAEEDLEKVRKKLSKVWQGNNADAYRQKLLEEETSMRKLSAKIKKIAAVVRKVAQTTYEAELTAEQTAAARVYNTGGR